MKKVVLFLALFVASTISFAQGMPVKEWSKYANTTAPGKFESVTIDKWNNIITVGEFYGTRDFDPGSGVFNITSNGQSDVFITKLDSNGNFIWAKSLGGVSYDTAFNVHVDTFGNVYTVGQMDDSGDYDPGPSVYMMGGASKQVFVSKLDMNGNFAWAKTFKNTNNYYQEAAFNVDKDANVYLFGYYHDTVDFGPVPNVNYLVDSLGGLDGSLFLLKLNSTGNFVWAKNFMNDGTALDIIPYAVEVDNNNNIVITGVSDGNLMLDNINSTYDMFIVKYNSTGTLIWNKGIGAYFGGYYFPLNGLTIDHFGNVYLVINGNRELYFPNNVTLNSSPYICSLDLAKYDSTGNFIWAKQIYDINHNWDFCLDNNNCVAVDSADNLIISGLFSQTIDFDMGANVHNLISNPYFSNVQAAFLYKIDTAGNYKWAYTPSDWGSYRSIALNKSGKIYAVGYDTSGTIIKYHEDPCATFNLNLDSIHSVICGIPAFIKVSAHDGTPPYNFQWSSGQAISSISPTIGGVYTVVVHDSIGCVDSESYLISNPAFPNTYFDLNSNFVNVGSLATWTNSPIGLDVFNDGCVAQNGTVKLVLDNLLNYYSAYPTPSQVIGDTVVWSFANLNYNTPHFQPHVTINPMGNMGDTVCVTTIVDPITGDANPANNIKTSCFVITGSFDPNDITVYPQGACDSGYVLPNTTFTYTIDFQNTGNAPAEMIYILDSLDTNLAIDSVKVVGSSHTMYTEVLPGNVLKFHFDNINLPYQNANDSASHGYVIYQVKAKNNIAMGSLLKNHADIYFDNNPPIITNEVFNKVVATIPNCNTGINTYHKLDFHLSPNPANNILNIQTLQSGRLEIMDLMGRLLLQSPITASTSLSNPNYSSIIDISALAQGVYLYRFVAENNQLAQGKLVIVK